MNEDAFNKAILEAENKPEPVENSAPENQAPEQVPADQNAPPANEPPAPEAPKPDAPAPKTVEEPAKPATPPAPVVEEKPIDQNTAKILEIAKSGPEAELALKKYFDEKFRDYSTMPEIDVLRENLKLNNPTWTDKDVALEMKHKYKPIPEPIDISEIDEYDTEAIAQAEEHNETVEYLQNAREREARSAREALEAQKQNIQLPEISTPQGVEYTPEQIAEMNQRWEAEVESALPNLSDRTFKVGDEEVTYRADDQEIAELTAKMKNFNDVEYLTGRGWYDENGNINILKVAEDVRLLENVDKMFASASTQVRTKVTKEVISKDIKNFNMPEGAKPPKPTGKTYAETLLNAGN